MRERQRHGHGENLHVHQQVEQGTPGPPHHHRVDGLPRTQVQGPTTRTIRRTGIPTIPEDERHNARNQTKQGKGPWRTIPRPTRSVPAATSTGRTGKTPRTGQSLEPTRTRSRITDTSTNTTQSV